MALNSDYFKKRSRSSYEREINNRGLPKQSFLIICEGSRTEPNYFRSFKLSSACIRDIEGSGFNTLSLVDEAIRVKNLAHHCGSSYDQVWCVFDKDDFPADNFDNAIKKASANKIKVAYSNQSFELWYLLHFCYWNSSLHRSEYTSRLDGYLGIPYKKNDTEIHAKLKERQNNSDKKCQKTLRTLFSQFIPQQE